MAERQRPQKGSVRITPSADLFVGLKPGDSLDIDVAAGKTERLAPDQSKWRKSFVKIKPETIADVRRYLGPSVEAEGGHVALRTARVELGARAISVADLESPEPEIRADARRMAYVAGAEIVRGMNPVGAHWHALADRLIAISDAWLNIVVVRDINIAEGATLVIDSAAHALYARHVRIHGTGRLRCEGSLTIRVEDLEGVLGIVQLPPGVMRAS